MYPLLLEDSFIILMACNKNRKFYSQALKIGDLVQCQHDIYGSIVKRIRQINDETLLLEGIHETSVTSEQMGKVYKSQVVAKVIYTIGPGKL